MGVIVCTVSGKGGTGKSTVSSGLAIAAASKNANVLLLDLDAGLRCLDTIFGIDEAIVFDLSDSIKENDLKKSIYKSGNYDNISVVPAPGKAEKIDFNVLHSLIESEIKNYDFIILDFPAGADFEAYSHFPDAVFLIVSCADDVSVKAAAVISGGIAPKVNKRLIINRFDKDMISAGFYKNIDDIINTSQTQLIGIVPADGELLLLSRNHKLKNKGRALRAFDRIIRRISGENLVLPDIKKI